MRKDDERTQGHRFESKAPMRIFTTVPALVSAIIVGPTISFTPAHADFMATRECTGIPMDHPDMPMCLGIIDGVGMRAAFYKGVCASESVTIGEMLEAARKYAVARPETLSDPWSVTVLSALVQRWPCKTPVQPKRSKSP
jgi:hypothetical protein